MCCICSGSCAHTGPHFYCEAHKPKGACPHCGYCKHCGRGRNNPILYLDSPWPLTYPIMKWGTTGTLNPITSTGTYIQDNITLTATAQMN